MAIIRIFFKPFVHVFELCMHDVCAIHFTPFYQYFNQGQQQASSAGVRIIFFEPFNSLNASLFD